MSFFRFDRSQLRGQQWKQFTLYHHFDFQWKNLAPYNARIIQTPLLQLRSYQGFSPPKINPKRRQPIFIVLFCGFLRSARSQAFVNSFRMTALQQLVRLPPSNQRPLILRISLFPAAKVAPLAEVADHLGQVLGLYSQPEVARQGARPKLAAGQNFKEVLGGLFPFDARSWGGGEQYGFSGLRDVVVSWKITSHPQQAQTNLKLHWILCHCYALNDPRQKGIARDLFQFRDILLKFNFFSFFQDPRISYCSQAKKRFFACRLVRSLKWQDPCTEPYLVFCIRVFGPSNMLTLLQDFAKVEQSFQGKKGTSKEPARDVMEKSSKTYNY